MSDVVKNTFFLMLMNFVFLQETLAVLNLEKHSVTLEPLML